MEVCCDLDEGGVALTLVREGGRRLRGGRPQPVEARRLFERALKEDYGNRPAKFALKALLWWENRLAACPVSAGGPRKGMFIIDQWEGFYRFLDEIGDVDKDSFQAVRHWISALAMDALDYNALNPAQSGDGDLQFKLGLCCKGVGDYERALAFLDTAAGLRREDTALLFERSDVWSLAGGDREARLILREALLADPGEARVYSMEGALFCDLYQAVRERGYEGAEILEWMPVWGTILGVFPFKCELNRVKLEKLKERIFEFENELKTEGGPGSQSGNKRLVPRLLNSYFWLAEHYEACMRRECPPAERQPEEEYGRLMKETLLKIKYTDGFIYKQFARGAA